MKYLEFHVAKAVLFISVLFILVLSGCKLQKEITANTGESNSNVFSSHLTRGHVTVRLELNSVDSTFVLFFRDDLLMKIYRGKYCDSVSYVGLFFDSYSEKEESSFSPIINQSYDASRRTNYVEIVSTAGVELRNYSYQILRSDASRFIDVYDLNNQLVVRKQLKPRSNSIQVILPFNINDYFTLKIDELSKSTDGNCLDIAGLFLCRNIHWHFND